MPFTPPDRGGGGGVETGQFPATVSAPPAFGPIGFDMQFTRAGELVLLTSSADALGVMAVPATLLIIAGLPPALRPGGERRGVPCYVHIDLPPPGAQPWLLGLAAAHYLPGVAADAWQLGASWNPTTGSGGSHTIMEVGATDWPSTIGLLGVQAGFCLWYVR